MESRQTELQNLEARQMGVERLSEHKALNLAVKFLAGGVAIVCS